MTAVAEVCRPSVLPPEDGCEPVVRLVASERYRRPLAAMLYRLGIVMVSGAGAADALVIAAASVDEGIELCADWHGSRQRGLLIADRFTPTGALKALRHDIRVMVSFDDLTPDRLLSAVESARHGDNRLSSDVVSKLLRGGADGTPAGRPGEESPITGRQREVLALMAMGHSNAAIADLLDCSEHTVKNVIYELMARLRVRNRAHAVAHAVRTGLI